MINMNNTTGKDPSPSLTFKGYIDQQINDDKQLLPGVDALGQELDRAVAQTIVDEFQRTEAGDKLNEEQAKKLVEELVETGKRIKPSEGVLTVIKTLDPKNPYGWYKTALTIVGAVMAANSGLDPQEVTTAVAYDMEALFQGYNNALKVAGAGR
jgi:hypothetical protein